MVVLVLQRVGGKGIKGVVFDQVDPGFINKGVGPLFVGLGDIRVEWV